MCRPVVVVDDKGKLLALLLDRRKGKDPLVKALDALLGTPAKSTGWQQYMGQCVAG